VPNFRQTVTRLLERGAPHAEIAKHVRVAQTGTLNLESDRAKDQVKWLLEHGFKRAQIARMLGLSKPTVSYHAASVGAFVDPRFSQRYDWVAIRAYYDAGHSAKECRAKFGFSRQSWADAVGRGAIVTRQFGMPIEQLLARPRSRHHLKGRLLGAGLLEERCECCGASEWLGRPLSLQLHHRNGDGKDNRLENLTLLCPNCHSQTDTWGGRNKRAPLRVLGTGDGAAPAA
jgi:DNA-binding XRE family transcriptional regulator